MKIRKKKEQYDKPAVQHLFTNKTESELPNTRGAGLSSNVLPTLPPLIFFKLIYSHIYPCSYVKFKTNQQRLRSNDKVIADTVYGKVKGVKWQSIYGNNYYSFEGIPFAKPPVGELRFKAPVEPEHWSDVKRCTHVRAKPCQVNIVLKQVQGSEDCLYLNVYTREVSQRTKQQVHEEILIDLLLTAF